MAENTEQKEKPLEKMTVTDLRAMAKEMPEITGVHGMNKAELVAAIKDVKGIKDETVKMASSPNRDLKKEIRDLKAKREAALEAQDRKLAKICKRKISRLKKKTRKAA